MNNRRQFILQVSVASVGSGLFLSANTMAQTAALAETDPQAVALGYKALATKADTKKYPKYAAGQNCKACALYAGKPGDAAAACPLFAGKQVAAVGWCSAWVKKAG